MARLRVEFNQVAHHLIQTFVQVEGEEHELWFCPLFYDDVLGRLCKALLLILEEDGKHIIALMDKDQTTTYDMKFFRRNDKFKLEVWSFWGFQSNLMRESELEFEVSGDCAEICVPFWRALRDLQQKYDATDFSQRWGEQFPVREFDESTRELKARRLS